MTEPEKHVFAGALEDWPVALNPRLGWGATDKDVFEWYCKHDSTIRAALTMAMQQAERPVVDVETLKKIKQYHHDGYYLSDDDRGWNDCLDHMQEKGLFRCTIYQN